MGKIVRIKVPANAIYDLSMVGDIKTDNKIVEAIFANKEATKKHNNVMKGIHNLLWEGKEPISAKIDLLTYEVVLELADEDYRTCCICGGTWEGYGNNPDPVKQKGRCCDECNILYVIPARMKALEEEENADGNN